MVDPCSFGCGASVVRWAAWPASAIVRRRATKYMAEGQAELALRIVDGTQEGLTGGWRKGVAALWPGRLDFASAVGGFGPWRRAPVRRRGGRHRRVRAPQARRPGRALARRRQLIVGVLNADRAARARGRNRPTASSGSSSGCGPRVRHGRRVRDTGAMTDAFVYDAVRTPFGRFDGALAKVRPDDLGATVLRAIAERSPALDTAPVDEVVFGNANGAGEDNRNVGRMVVAARRLPGGGAGQHDQPAVRLQPRRGDVRVPRDRERRRRRSWWRAASSR